MEKVIIIAHHLYGSGGAQREIVGLANQLAARGYQLNIVVFASDQPLFYPLAGNICLSELDLTSVPRPFNYPFGRLLFRIIELKKWINQRESNAVISFSTDVNLLVICATFFSRRKVIVSELNDFTKTRRPRVRKLLITLLYRRANYVTANGRYILNTLARYLPDKKLTLTRKPYQLPERSVSTDDRRSGINFLCVGRIDYQKGYDVLLKSLALLNESLQNWRLQVLGSGPLSEQMRQLSRELGICSKITWHGVKKDTGEYYLSSSIFVLPSRYEGVPNALLEAMGYGLPIVVSNVPGSLEYAKDEVNALVFPIDDHKALATQLRRLMEDRALSSQLGSSARATAAKLAKIDTLSVWQSLIN